MKHPARWTLTAPDGNLPFMKLIETYSVHQAGNVTRRLAQLPGASELPRLVVTVERGTDLRVMAEELRHLATMLDPQA